MRYKVVGTPLPVLTCYLEPNETIITQSGAMSWMTPNMHMDATTNGGVSKAIGRMFTGEAFAQVRYTATKTEGMISMASSFPGSIVPFEISSDNEIVVQKHGFLAAEHGVVLSVFFQKRFGGGLFGGEGFIMQRLSGKGLAFVEIDGHVIKYTLEPNQSMIVDTGYLAAMSATCTIDVQSVGSIKNALFGGEGLFNTVVTGPGEIYLQTVPINKLADSLKPYLPKSN